MSGATRRGKTRTSVDRASLRGASRSQVSRLIPTVDELVLPSFVAVDFETANRSGGVSACQVALVRVEEGEVTDRFSTLLQPPPGWDRFEFTYLHGISAGDVVTAPSWAQVARRVVDFVGGTPVYAHNASFDAKVWRELDLHFGISTFPQRFFCSYRTARRLLPGLQNYKLPTVVQACVPGYQLDHHKADSDAEACALVVCALQKYAK